MYQLKEHIISKIAIVVLVVALMMPSVAKIIHEFSNHKHEICLSEHEEHYHNVDIDCEFYKFKKTSEFIVGLSHCDITSATDVQKPINFYYSYLSTYKQLSPSLRGPPNS